MNSTSTIYCRKIVIFFTGKAKLLICALFFLLSYKGFSQTQNVPAVSSVSSPAAGLMSSSEVSPDIKNMLNYYDKQVYFTQNKGQWDSKILYRADFKLGQALATKEGMLVGTFNPADAEAQAQWITKQEASHISHTPFTESEPHLRGNGWTMNFINHSPLMTVEGKTKHKDVFNYFIGNQSQTNINSYQEIWYNNVYDNVSVRYYPSKDGSLEYDMICKPGFNKDAISIKMDGISKVILKKDGSLVLKTSVGEMKLPTPVAYQNINGQRVPVDVHYVVTGNNIVTFNIGNFDKSKTLLIDPIALRWATWLCTNSTGANHAHCVWVDASDNIYTVARVEGTSSATITAGAFDVTANGTLNMIIGKYTEPTSVGGSGTRVWQTYVGGNDDNNPYAAQMGPDGNLYITGYTTSSDFPLTGGTAFSGEPASINEESQTTDNIFVLKITPDGQSIKGGVIGGNGDDESYDLRFTSTGDVLVCGETKSGNLATLFPGSGATGTSGSATTIYDVFVFRINANFDTIRWMKNYGGSGTGVVNVATIMVDNPGNDNIYVAGYTSATNFPTTSAVGEPAARQSALGGSESGFIQKLNSAGTTKWSSYFDAASGKTAQILCMEFNTLYDEVYFGGLTNGLASSNISAGAYQTTIKGTSAFFVANMDTNQTFVSGTYVGGTNTTGNNAAINMMGLNTDQNNDVYVLAYTTSTAFPTTNGAVQTTNMTKEKTGQTDTTEVFLKLYTTLDSLEFSSYYGGTFNDYDPVGERGIKFSNCRIYTLVTSESDDIPLTQGTLNSTKSSSTSIYEPGLVVWSNPPDLLDNTIMGDTVVCKGGTPSGFTGSMPSYSLPTIIRNNVVQTPAYTVGGSATSYQWQSSTDSINWTNIPSGTTQNLSSSLIGALTVTTYFRRIISGDACIIAGAADQTVKVIVASVGATVNNVTCNGLNNGSITANPTGPSPYTFTWSTGASTQTISSLEQGTYSVTVTDGNNCTYSNSFIITQPAVLAETIASQTNPTTCVGNNGSCTANTPTGGTPPYTYNWTPSGGTGLTASNLTAGTYTITAMDKNGCTATATAILPQPTKITALITATNTSFCIGTSSATLKASASGGTGSFTYTWSPSTGLNVTTGSSVSASPTVTTTYTVTATDGNGCTGTATQVVTIYPLPTVSVTATSSAICAGNKDTLTASGATSYTWSPSGSLSASTGVSVTADPTLTTTYTVTGTNGNGCVNTRTVTVTVNPLPTVSVTAKTSSICISNVDTLKASGATSYTWSPSGSLSASTGAKVIANPTAATTYTVTGMNGNGCTNTYNTIVTVNPLPTVSITATSSVICTGNNDTLAASGATSYTWSPSGSLSASTGVSVTADPTVTTTYTVTGTNGNGCVNTGTVTVQVNSLPIVTATPTSTSICTGNNDTLAASGATSYTWSPSGSLSASTGAKVIANPTATTTYTVTGMNGNGCTNTYNTIVTVNPLPTVSITATSSVICTGNNDTLAASGATSYTWSPSGSLSASTGAKVIANPTSTTTYTVTGTNGNGCTNTYNTIVTVNPLPTVSVTATSSAICTGNNDTLTATGATSYTWSPAGSLSASTGAKVIANPTATTTYTVTGTNGNGCTNTYNTVVTVNPLPTLSINVPITSSTTICYGSSGPTLTVKGAKYYLWSPTAGLQGLNNVATDSVVIASPTVTTTYVFTGTNGAGCTSTDSIVITVNPKPVITVDSTTICYGDTATIQTTNNEVGGTYTWSPSTGLLGTTGASVKANPAVTTTYQVIFTNIYDCSDTAIAQVVVNPLPTVSVTASSSAICTGNNDTLTASGATSYSWSPSGSLSASTGAKVIANPIATTTYTVTGTNGNGCTNTYNTVVTVNPLPTVSVTATSTSICTGNNDTLTASGATSYTWSPSGSLSASTGVSVTADPTVTTTYTVTGTNGNGCVSTGTVTVKVNSLPIVTATPTSASICTGNNDTLTASGATSYTWSPSGSLSASTGVSVTADPTVTTTYTVTGTNGNGCVSTGTVTVKVNSLPIVTATPTSTSICTGNNDTLTASGATSYTWSPSGSLSASTGVSVTADPTVTTTYTVTGTNGNGCVSTGTVMVKVNSLPIVSATPTSASICTGNNDTLTASGATSYTWSPSGSLSASTGVLVTADPTVTTTYTVTGTNGNGCVSTGTVTVKVNPLPIVSATPTSASICTGNNDTLTASGATSYTWSPSGSLSASTGVSVTADPTVTTTYTVTGTNGNGCVSTCTVTVKVNSLPIVTATPTSTSICTGNNDTLTASGATSYTWSPSGSLSASTGVSVTADPTVTTTYTVTGTNGNGCVSTGTVTVKVNSLPIVSATPTSASICTGNNDTLTASGATSYTWSPSGSLSASTGVSVTADPTVTTTYTVTGTNGNGCVSTGTVTVKVNPLPIVSATPTSASICTGNNDTLTASGATSYTWSPSGSLSASTGVSVTADPTVTTTYTVTGTNGNGCVNTSTVTVSVNLLPTVSITPTSSAICIGNNDTLTASGTISYTWSPAGSLSASTGVSVTADPTVTTTYTVTGTNGNGCVNTGTVTVKVNPLPIVSATPTSTSICTGNNDTLTASGATSYTWSPSGSLSASTGVSVTADPTVTTTYTVTGTNGNGCVSTCTVTVKVNSLPIITATPTSTSICTGNNDTLTASGATSYTWSPSGSLSASTGVSVTADPTVTTTYTVTGTNGNGCVSTGTVTVKVNSLPIVTATPTSASICTGNNDTLTASGATSYTWSPSGSLSASTGVSVTADPTVTTTYTVTGTNGNGCVSTGTVTVKVNSLPIVTATPTSASICTGNNDTLTASGATSYTWSPSGSLSASTGVSVTADPTVTTTYTVTGTNGNGCVSTGTVTVKVNSLPIVTATPTSASICTGNNDTLTASGATSYTWSPSGSLSASTGVSVTADPTVTTTYTVTGTNGNGCTNNYNVTVKVNPLPTVSITPNSTSICPGSTDTLKASGATSYTWSPSGSLSASAGATVIASPSGTTTYTVTGTNGSGCTNTATVTITVNPLLTVSVTASTPAICTGSTDTLTASGADSYTWSPSESLSTSTGAKVIANPTATTTYTVTGTNGNGCTNTKTVTVTVNPLPYVTVTLTSLSICSGTTDTLRASGATSYTWSPSGSLSASSGTQVIASPSDTTTYTVTGTNDNGCVNTAKATVDVKPAPKVTIGEQSSTICAGIADTLTASGAESYTWSPSTGLSATTGSSVIASPTISTTYSVVGISNSGCVSLNVTLVSITVNPLPNISITQSDSPICVGGIDTLRPTGATSYTWTPAVNMKEGLPYVTVSPSITTTYTVIGTNGNGCTDTTTVVVKVNQLPMINVTPATICYGDNGVLTASGATSYTWSPSIGLSATTGSSVSADPTVTTTYTVTGTNTKGCSNTATSVVTVNPLPTISVGTPAPICAGSSTVLTATGATSYTWSPASGLSATSGSSVAANPSITTTYTVSGTNGNKCSNSTTVTVTVNPLPTVSVTLSSSAVCSGSNDTLWPSGATSYTWIPQVNTQEGLPYVIVTPTVTTTYTVIGLNGNSCTDTIKVIVSVLPSTKITSQLKNDTVCSGSSAAFNISATGSDLTYQWQFDGKNITGANSSEYSILSVTATDTGEYDVIVTGSCGSDTSNIALLKFGNNPPVIKSQPVSVTLCSTGGKCGGSKGVTFCVEATGNNLTYQWQFDGKNIKGANSSCYTINPVILSDSGSYDVIITGGCGSITSDTAKLIINSSPVIISQPKCVSVCSGSSATFCVTASGTDVTYQWQFNGKNINGANGSCYTVSVTSPANTGCYDVVVTNSCGSVTSSIATLTITTPPIITCQPKDESLCSTNGKCGGNDGVTFCVTATGSDLKYQWQYNGKNIKGANSSCYTINPVTTSDAGCYDVIVSNSCGSDTSNIAVLTIGSSPVITSQPVCVSVCSGSSATFCITATGSNLTYQWQFNGKNIKGATSCCYTIPSAAACNAGCYDVVVSNSCGSVTSCTVTLTINTQPVITCQPQSQSICSVGGKCGGGEGVTFCVTATGSDLKYQWQYNGKNIKGANSSCYTINPVTTSNAGCYDVIVSNSCGSQTSNTVTLTIGSSPVITSQPVCVTVCSGNSATFCVTATGSNLSYKWQFNGKNINGATSCCYTIPSAAACNAGCYDVVVSNSCGSVTSCTVTLTVNGAPCITSQPVCQTVCAGSGVTFCVIASGSNLSYQWQYNGKNISGANSCCYTIESTTSSNAGCYDVIVSNSCSCVTSNTATLTVNNCSTCEVPTDLKSSDITCTGATLSWSYSSSASSFTVEYKALGCSTWSTETVKTNSLTLSCLTSGTTYEWSVSENCSCGSSSGYASVVEFCTSTNCCNGNNMAPRGDGNNGDGHAISDVKVYPNPTFSLTTVHATFEKQSDVTVMVTDLTGRIIMSETETAPAGDYIRQFDMSQQQAGTYFLIIRSSDQMITSKIVKIE